MEKNYISNILPPPPKVTEHDNNVATAFSQTSSKSVSEDAPTEQVFIIVFGSTTAQHFAVQ